MQLGWIIASNGVVESDMGWRVGYDGLSLCSVLQLPWRERGELGHWSSADGTGSFSLIYNFIKISSERGLIISLRLTTYSAFTLSFYLGSLTSHIHMKGL